MTEEKQKEIQLVDPLYEPMIMYSLINLPMDESCFKNYENDYRRNFDVDHFQNLVRRRWKKSFLFGLKDNEKEQLARILDIESIDELEKKNLMREIRKAKVKKPSQINEFKIRVGAGEIKVKDKIKERRIKESGKCIYPMNCTKPLPIEYRRGTKHYSYEEFDHNTALKELYDLYNELINTFEVKRLMYIQMTGFLAYKYPSSSHTRYSHAIGTWIGGLHALQNVTVDNKRLIEFLSDEDIHREFMASLMLHDIGHAPFSHVIEMSPFIEYNHENVAQSLIEGTGEYIKLEDVITTSYLDLVYHFDHEYGTNGTDFIEVCKVCRGNIRLVHDVCKKMGLKTEIIVALFNKGYDNIDDPAVKAMKGLVHGVIDIDRIDHIYRDLYFNGYKTMGIPLSAFFRGIKVHYEDAIDRPYIEISEEILPFVETLMEAREQSAKAIFNTPINNFYIAVLNKAVTDAKEILPLFEHYLPTLTDQALLHLLLNEKLFYNTPIPTWTSILTSSGFEHSNYYYAVFRIRIQDASPGREVPTKEDMDTSKQEFKEILAKELEKISPLWYYYIKDVGKSYDVVEEETTPIHLGERIEGTNDFNIILERLINGITWDAIDKRSFIFILFSDEKDKTGNMENTANKLPKMDTIKRCFNKPITVKNIYNGWRKVM